MAKILKILPVFMKASLKIMTMLKIFSGKILQQENIVSNQFICIPGYVAADCNVQRISVNTSAPPYGLQKISHHP